MQLLRRATTAAVPDTLAGIANTSGHGLKAKMKTLYEMMHRIMGSVGIWKMRKCCMLRVGSRNWMRSRRKWWEKQEEVIKEIEDEKEDKETKMNDLDDGRGAFIIVNRRRARPKKRAGGGNTAQWIISSEQ